MDEPGSVTLSTLQPQVEVVIMATLDDPDNEMTNGITWQWYRGSSPITGADNGENTNTSMYTPATGDVGSRLRARAMYDDGEGKDKMAQEDSANRVRSAPDTNTDPVFPDQDLNTDDVQTGQEREVAENTPAGRNLGARIVASDPVDVLTYSLSGVDAASFDINRATGQLTTKAALNFEMAVDQGTNNEYEVTVTATDPIGATDTSEVTITVTDVNEDPVVTGPASIDHEENGTVLDVDASNDNADAAVYTVTDEDGEDDATDLTWLLSGADASKFEITDTGATRTLAFKANPDYESPGDSGANNVYEVTVKVTDSEGNSDEQDVTVKVTNVEEMGTVTLSTLQPRVGIPLTATLTDPDNITAGSVSWQWYRGDNIQTGTLPETECAQTTANDCAIKDATSDAYTPAAGDITRTLTAVATYTDGSPNEGDAKDVTAGEADNTVLADTRNKAPVFPDQDTEMDGRQTAQERSVMENTASGVTIGAPVVAMDFITANDGDSSPEILTYSLGGADADSFSIDRSTAQISTKAKLDKETKDTYTVMVTATDPSNETATVTVTIKVTNVDEAPMIMVGGLAISGMTRVDYAENGTDAVATYAASGPDAASATWTLEGDDAGQFSIPNGMLMFMTAPDYEMPMDADMDNEYMVTVKAGDGTYMDTHDVTITVTNVDEMGRVTFWRGGADATTAAIMVGDMLTGLAEDPDGNVGDTPPITDMYPNITGATWQWAKTMTPVMMDSWMDITGATDAAYTVMDADEGYYLRATAMYDDGEGSGKNAMATTGSAVTDVDEADRTRDAIRLEIEQAILDALSDGIDDAERSAIERLILDFALAPSS